MSLATPNSFIGLLVAGAGAGVILLFGVAVDRDHFGFELPVTLRRARAPFD